jgi:hypothetical protein
MKKDRRYSRTIKKARTVGDAHANSSSPCGTIPYVRRENTNLSARSHLSKIPAGPITNCQTAHLSLSLVSSSGRRHPSSLRAPAVAITAPRTKPTRTSRRNGLLPRSSILPWRNWRRPPLLTRSPTTPGLPLPRDNHHHLVDRCEAARGSPRDRGAIRRRWTG